MALTADEQAPYKNQAKRTRRMAQATETPLQREFEARAQPTFGPWNIGARDGESPLPPELLKPGMKDRKSFMAAVDAWRTETDKLMPPNTAFPSTVAMTVPCCRGECTHRLAPGASAAFRKLSRYVRLACRYRGDKAPFILEFAHTASGQIRSAASGQSLSTASGQSDTASGQSGTASGHGSSVLYALVGLHANTYSLEAELFPLVRTRDTSAGAMVLRCQVDATTQPHNTPWPRIVSETGWLLPLARQAPPTWKLWHLRAASACLGEYVVSAREELSFEQLEQYEASRLEVAAAKRLMKKLRQPQPTAAPHLGESSDEGEAEPNRARGSADPRGCREPGRPKDVVRDGSNQGIPWGSSGWLISRIQDKGEWVGMGAICGHHHNAGDSRRCQKNVTFGSSGLDEASLILRLKRWLVAGSPSVCLCVVKSK